MLIDVLFEGGVVFFDFILRFYTPDLSIDIKVVRSSFQVGSIAFVLLYKNFYLLTLCKILSEIELFLRSKVFALNTT